MATDLKDISSAIGAFSSKFFFNLPFCEQTKFLYFNIFILNQ